MKSARRRAREFAVQGLYQWQIAGHAAPDIVAQLSEATGFDKIDRELFQRLLAGVIERAPELESTLAPALDRKFAELSPIERGVLLLGAYELAYEPATPYKVVINEAVDLAKTYGATDGHKYVNGVLDKLALELRAAETGRRGA